VATAAPTSVALPSRPAQQLGALGQPGRVFRDCDGCPEMVVIPAGSFTMGSPASEPGRDSNEGPQHPVSIARPFAAGKHEVTRGQFARFVQEAGYPAAGGCYIYDGSKWTENPAKNWRDPGFPQTDNDPVACINWQDAKAYTDWLSRKTARGYRLLTEAEWEYVARAGTTTAFEFGNSISPQQANYDTRVSYAGSPVATSRGQTAPVGSYSVNAFGLHDVHGNVWEWTEDCWNENYIGAPSDGTAPNSGNCTLRVLRGGSWGYFPQYLRSAYRGRDNSSNRSYVNGFRVARTN
jgi:formylglycine-generating enzyme required for sulfatase activity